MGLKKGTINNPEGRPRGSANKITKDIRQSYQLLIENNIENINNWLLKVAKDDPAKAVELIIKLSEYTIPKLARTESIDNGLTSIVFKNIDPFAQIRKNCELE